MWFPVDEPWQYRVLDRLPSGIDEAQLAQQRRMTPTERVEAAVRLMELADEMRRARAQRRREEP